MLAERPAPLPAARHILTPLQEGMLYHHLRDPQGDSDIQQVVLFSSAPLDAERLRASWQEVTERHDILRSSFRWDGERPLAEVWTSAPTPFTFDDYTGARASEHDALIERCLDQERALIDLTTAPLARVRLLRFAAADHAIVWTNHHAILDGRARSIVLGEIAARYAGRELGPAGPQFSGHAEWLGAREGGTAERFWRDYLSGVEASTPLPASARVDGETVPAARVKDVIRTLDETTTAGLTAFARAHGFTLTTLVQAAWALLLARCASASDVVFGSVRACRHSGVPGSADIVGPLINTLPLRITVDENDGLLAWLGHVRSQWQALRDVEQTPLPAIAAWAPFGPGALFETLVVVEHEPLAVRARTALDPSGALAIRDALVSDRTGYPLTLAAAGTSRLELRLHAEPSRYDRADAERLIDALATILAAFPAAESGRVRDVSMTSEAERQRVLAFNTVSEFPRDATVQELFAGIVAQYPDVVAAQLGAESMTYAELARRGDAVAFRLRAEGVGRGTFVGICVERSFDMLAALLGILQAGAASVAVDPLHPPDRIAHMLGQAGAEIVLGQRHLLDQLVSALATTPAAGLRTIACEDIPPHEGAAFVSDPACGPMDAAHVMYTSGSTGMPKGAVLPHRALVRTVRGADYLNFDRTETFFAFVPLTFDVAVLEIWGPLLNGGRLVLCPPGLPSLDVLGETIETQGVTTLWLTTALFEHMVDEQVHRLHNLHALIVGGDVMSPSHARRAMAALPNTRILNVCGPTEATVLIVAQHLRRPPESPIPIGVPIKNARVYLLDPDMRPVPVGVPGEIYTGGDGVALGYLNQPELNAEKFIPDPFDDRPGAIMYRAGDLGRWNVDGSILPLGRIDTQVKINGVRIELGEIESTLTEHPGLREAVVIATAGGSGEKQLVAFAVARGASPPPAADVRAFLAKRLPSAMVPAHVVFLDALPVTPTGKFDRKALPQVEFERTETDRTAKRLPDGAAEITVAAHVEQLLERDGVCLDDDFFAIGGDSLRAMRLVSRLRDVFGVDLSIRDILAAPTVAGMTSAVVRLQHGAVRAPAPLVTPLRTGGSKTPFVFLHGDLAGGGYYCGELARHIDVERPMYVIAPNGTESGSAPPETIEAAARENVAALAAAGIRGPLVLGGFCNGGTVAYEMARLLARAGIPVERVILVDAVPKNVGMPYRKRIRRWLRSLLDLFGYARRRLPRSPGERANWEQWHEYIVDRWHYTLADYVPGPYGGSVALLWSAETAPSAGSYTERWQRLAPGAYSDRISGTHLTSITRHLATTCAVLAAHVEGSRANAQRDQRVTELDLLHRSDEDAGVLA